MPLLEKVAIKLNHFLIKEAYEHLIVDFNVELKLTPDNSLRKFKIFILNEHEV